MNRKLIGDPNLEFVAMPALVPPEVGTATNSHFPSTVGNNPNFCVPCTSSFKLTGNFFQVTMDPQWQQKIEQDIKEAQDTALPEDDEDL